jgi:hypothetical protein
VSVVAPTPTLTLRSRRRTGIAALALVLAGCGTAPAPAAPPVESAVAAPARATSATPVPVPPTAPTPADCPDPAWSCTQQQRFAAAAAHARRAAGPHGHLAAVFVDRTTGATWRTGDTGRPGWTASTIKLAIAADLLARDRAGTIALTAADRRDMAGMLDFSDEAASDRLWKAYGGADMLDRFRSGFGMSALRFVPGFSRTTYWGFVRCSTDDLAHLMQHVLTRTDPADRAYLVAAMRGVARNQQWGVWAAGAAQRPGNKDGWSFESDPGGRHWVTDTVGFAGPDERYVVAVMDQLDPAGTLPGGVHAVSDLVALLFGRPVPAPVTVPAPDG